MNAVRIDREGRLAIPTPGLRAIGERPLRLASWSAQHLLLEAADAGGGVLLAGALGEIGIVDLLSFCNMFRKSGLLHFSLAGGDKSLYFRNGEIAYATSSFPAPLPPVRRTRAWVGATFSMVSRTSLMAAEDPRMRQRSATFPRRAAFSDSTRRLEENSGAVRRFRTISAQASYPTRVSSMQWAGAVQ